MGIPAVNYHPLLEFPPDAPPLSALAEATPAQRRTLLAAALGWMLDAFDVMLYALVVSHIMRDLNMSKPVVGLLNTLMLLASGAGGLLFGVIADRIGRARALSLSILTYSIFSFASGLSQSILQLAVFRTFLGLGMGGEWNTGATLVAETWPSHLRARALSMVQSSWAIGYALAALVAGVMLRLCQLALRLLRRRAAGAGHTMDPAARARVGDVAIASQTESSQTGNQTFDVPPFFFQKWHRKPCKSNCHTPSQRQPLAAGWTARTPLCGTSSVPLCWAAPSLCCWSTSSAFSPGGDFRLDPALSFHPCRSGWARLRRALDHRPAADPQSAGHAARLSLLRAPADRLGRKGAFVLYLAGGRTAGAAL